MNDKEQKEHALLLAVEFETSPTMLNRLVNWFRTKRFLMTHRTKLFLWQMDGKKYLAVHATGWRGKKWSRRFEVVDEVDDELQPMSTHFPEPYNLRSGD